MVNSYVGNHGEGNLGLPHSIVASFGCLMPLWCYFKDTFDDTYHNALENKWMYRLKKKSKKKERRKNQQKNGIGDKHHKILLSVLYG